MRRDERGSALVEVTWLGILLMVPLVYVVLSVFEVQRGAFAVGAAARSAARAYSLAPSPEAGVDAARAATRVALDDQGLEGQDFDLDISCTPDPHACLTPGSTIRVVVRTHVDLPLVPDVLGDDRPTFRLDAVQQVPYGSYREAP
jgi:hypothetical protein